MAYVQLSLSFRHCKPTQIVLFTVVAKILVELARSCSYFPVCNFLMAAQ